MSQKRKNQRAHHTEQEKQQGEKVFRNIVIGLAVLAVAYAVYTIVILS